MWGRRGRRLALLGVVGVMMPLMLAACGTQVVTVVVEADHGHGLVAEPNAPTLPAQVEIGQNVSDVSLNQMEGGTVQIGDYAGSVVLLFFWSTDVHPRGGIEQISTYSDLLSDDGLVAFAVNSTNDSEAAISFFIKDFSRGLPVVIDSDQRLKNLFGAGLQTMVWIGPNGELKSIQRRFNFNEFRQENLLYRVNYYLNEESN